jgi:hypothetical protein
MEAKSAARTRNETSTGIGDGSHTRLTTSLGAARWNPERGWRDKGQNWDTYLDVATEGGNNVFVKEVKAVFSFPGTTPGMKRGQTACNM